ncbi:MAG: hypothetical protein CME32_31535 [Gimesia sp.]|nr:hypothetical protein [Gimesia sp.]
MSADDLEETQTSAIGKFFHAISYFLLFMIFVVGVLSVQWLCWNWIENNIPEDKQGSFGDMFGSVNTLFSGLAFAGVLFTIFLQSRELSATRSELKLTRLSHQKTTQIMDKQLEILEKTSAIEAARYLDQFLPEFASDREQMKHSSGPLKEKYQLSCQRNITNTKNAIKEITIRPANGEQESEFVYFAGSYCEHLPRNQQMRFEYLRVENNEGELVCDVEFSTMDDKCWECQFLFGTEMKSGTWNFEYTPIKEKVDQRT